MLDTNVLMHDPTAIFRFEEHDIYLPMVVLEELDTHKKGLSESSRNVRQVSRFLDELMRGANKEQIDRGLALPSSSPTNHIKRPASGRLFFQTKQLSRALPESLPGQGADNAILSHTLALSKEYPEARVTLVSKDINLRIKAAVLGIRAEDYYSDKTIEDADVLYTGMTALPADFWEHHSKGMRSWKQAEHTFYEISGPAVGELQPNLGVYEDRPEGIEAIVRKVDGEKACLGKSTQKSVDMSASQPSFPNLKRRSIVALQNASSPWQVRPGGLADANEDPQDGHVLEYAIPSPL